jgi:hypothetical protein
MVRPVANRKPFYGFEVFDKNMKENGIKCEGGKGTIQLQISSDEYVRGCMTRPEYNRKIPLASVNFKRHTNEHNFTLLYNPKIKKVEIRLRRSYHPASEADSFDFSIWTKDDSDDSTYLSPSHDEWKVWAQGHEWMMNFVEKYGVENLESFLVNFVLYDVPNKEFKNESTYPAINTIVHRIRTVELT